MIIVIFRALFYYFLILIFSKIMGKKRAEELNISDLLISIFIVVFSLISIVNYNDSFLLTLIPILIIILLQLLISKIPINNFKLRSIINQTPPLIIKDGKINFKEMEEQKYNIDDLLAQVRNKGIKSLDEIEYAILENNRKLSIFLHDNKKTYPMPLILDGIIQYDTLSNINKNKVWLMKLLNEEHTNLSDVFYAFYKNKKCFIIKKKID